jgi:hypothetical protein
MDRSASRRGQEAVATISWKTVNGHLRYATTVLESWGPSVTSLREITTAHVQEAVDNASGVDGVFTALRSLSMILPAQPRSRSASPFAGPCPRIGSLGSLTCSHRVRQGRRSADSHPRSAGTHHPGCLGVNAEQVRIDRIR